MADATANYDKQEIMFVPTKIVTEGVTATQKKWRIYEGYHYETTEVISGSSFSDYELEKPVKVRVKVTAKGIGLERVEKKESTEPATPPAEPKPLEAIVSESNGNVTVAANIQPKVEPPKMEQVALKTTEPIKAEVIEAQSGVSMMLLHKAEIDTAIATAHAFPRSITRFIDTAISYATLDSETAAGCTYALPRGGKLIEGPSVRLAEIVCSTYTNIRAEGRVIEITQDEVIARGVCMDLETNNTQSSEVRVKIKDKLGNRYNQDMITMTGNQAAAKARRNAIFMVVPGVFTKKIQREAKKVAAGDEKTLPQRRDAAVGFFKSLKVTEAQICDVLGVQKIGDITLEHYAIMASMAQQIQNKENTVEELFSKQSETDLEAARTQAKAKLSDL